MESLEQDVGGPIPSLYYVVEKYCRVNAKSNYLYPGNVISTLAACTGEAALRAAGLFDGETYLSKPFTPLKELGLDLLLAGERTDPTQAHFVNCLFGTMERLMPSFSLSQTHMPTLGEITEPFETRPVIADKMPLAIDEVFQPTLPPLRAAGELRPFILNIAAAFEPKQPIISSCFFCTNATLMAMSFARDNFDSANPDHDRRIAQRIAFGTIWGVAHTAPLSPSFIKNLGSTAQQGAGPK